MRCFWIGDQQEKIAIGSPALRDGQYLGYLLPFSTEVVDRQFQDQQGYTRQQDYSGFVK